MGEGACIVKQGWRKSAIKAGPGYARMSDSAATLGVILAGGRARRIGGGDKILRGLARRSIASRIVARFAPQCDGLILNANGDPARFAALGLPIVADDIEGYAGPLAGLLAALDWAATNRPAMNWVASVAGDCPFLPHELVALLHEARIDQNAQLAVAASGERRHPVIGLWSVSLREHLRHALSVEGCRKVDDWIGRYRFATVWWPTAPFDPFFNINTLADLVEGERIADLADD
jgi:molybdenum cofactor guanylyltransferase